MKSPATRVSRNEVPTGLGLLYFRDASVGAKIHNFAFTLTLTNFHSTLLLRNSCILSFALPIVPNLKMISN